MTLSRKKASAQKSAVIFQQIVSFSTEYLNMHIQTIVDSIENEFMIKSDIAESSSGSLSNLSKAIDVKKLKSTILKTFIDEFSDTFTGKHKIHEHIEDDDRELSLMDETVIQENLLIDNFVIRVNEQYKPSIQAISKGIIRLSRSINTNPEPQALSPEQLGYTFQKAIDCLNLSFAHKPFAYNLLHNNLFTRLSGLYSGILTLLLETQTIESSENPIETNYSLICDHLSVISNFDETEDDDEDDLNDYTISDITGSDGTVDAALVKAINLDHTDADHSNTPVPAITLTRESFGSGEIADTLFELISHKNKDAAQSGQQVVQPSELQTLLSKLQADQGTAKPESEAFTQARLVSQQVETTLKALHKTIKKRPSNTELNTIHIMNKLFVAILSDNILPDPIKYQISRLQIPYLKAALLDTTIFVDVIHPARLLLNEIANHGVGATLYNHPATESITTATQYLLEKYKTNAIIFKQSYKKLRSIKKTANEKVSSLEQKHLPETENKAKLMYRKRLVTNTLKHILSNKQLPEALHTLTLQGFAQILDKRSQQYGPGSTEFNDAGKLIRNIVNSTQPYTSSYVLNEIFSSAPRFISQAQTMLLEVYPESKTTSLLKELEAYYLGMAHDYKNSLDQRDPDDTTLPMIKEQLGFQAPLEIDFGTTSNLPPAEIMRQLPDYIEVGSWFDVYSANQGKPRRLKLVSILEDTAQLIFFNRLAKQTVIKNAGTFLEEIQSERSRTVDTNHIFEKALTVAIANMKIAIEQNKI